MYKQSNTVCNAEPDCKPGASQVESELQDMRGALDHMECLLESLDKRICPVLRTPGPEVAEAEGLAPEMSLVPLAEAIRSQRRRMEGLNGRFQSWLNLIEL